MENMLHKFYEWEHWVGIMHHAVMILGIYIVYIMIKKNKASVTNLLLLAILLSIMITIHQKINNENQQSTNYMKFAN